MNKSEFENSLHRQCRSIPTLCAPQLEGVRRGLAAALSAQELRGIRRVVITGCGDSYVAAQAAIPAFKKFAGRFGSSFEYARAIDAARFMTFPANQNAATLVVAVSCSGGPARISEVLRRAGQCGCTTLAVTNNPASPAAQEAQHSLIVNTPAFPDPNPGLRNYYASLTALYLLAAALGEATGCSAPGAVDEMDAAIRTATAAWEPRLEEMDEQMFTLAQQWVNCRSFDFIGDDIEYATAFFCAAKIVETTGSTALTDDAEDWCHVGFFQRRPDEIGTVMVADITAGDRSRIGETAAQAAGVGRPLLLVANGTKEDFGITADLTLCQVPTAPVGYEFLLPLLNYLPGAMLAGYLSALRKEPFFRGGGVWAAPGASSIRTSKIEIV